jgi:hypothetical protein
MSIRTFFRKITGISTPFGGLSWRSGVDVPEEVRRLTLFLEDRRVLYNRFDNEQAHFVFESVQEVRSELLSALRNAGYSSKAAQHIRGMQAECRRFLDDAAREVKKASQFEEIFSGASDRIALKDWDYYVATINFYTALGSFRRGFGEHFTKLCESYRIDSPLLEHFQVPERDRERVDD